VAYTVPLTAVANAALTAAQWNASVRDNFAETAPGKATTSGSIFVATGLNSIAERPVLSMTVDTAETTASTTYVDLATVGPFVTTTVGDKALLMCNCQIANSAATAISISSWEITGSFAAGPSDNTSINFENTAANQDMRAGDTRRLTSMTPGTITVTMKYRVTTGTGTFQRRSLILIGL